MALLYLSQDTFEQCTVFRGVRESKLELPSTFFPECVEGSDGSPRRTARRGSAMIPEFARSPGGGSRGSGWQVSGGIEKAFLSATFAPSVASYSIYLGEPTEKGSIMQIELQAGSTGAGCIKHKV